MVRVLMGLLLVGGRRLRHLAFVQNDPLFQRFGEVQVVPTARTVSRWLQGFTMTTVARLQAINTAVVARVLATLGVRTWTIDVDGVVVLDRAAGRAGLPRVQPASPEGAELLPDHGALGRDYSRAAREKSVGARPRRESGAALLAGPVGATDDAAATRRDGPLSHGWRVFPPGCAAVARRAARRLRHQGAFYHWLDLQQYIRAQPTWRPVAPDVTGFVVPQAATPWGHPVWVAIYRKHVRHRATKNYQLDLFDPNDGHYEYSAVTSNLDLTLANLWRFACGRGNHEKTIAQLKSGLAFHTVPTMTYAANSAWQHLVVLTHNLLTNFQIETGAVRRTPSRKRTVLHVLQTIQSLRFAFFNRAAQLVRPHGTLRLRLMDNLETRRSYERVANALPRAAA